MSESLSSKPFWNYWGKARPAEAGPDFHRLVYHSLDVAAVGSAFLKASPRLLDTCCERLHCSPSAFLSWASFFLALHDLGKFSNTFQLQRPDLVQRLQHRDVSAGSYGERHDTLGFWIWKEHVRAGVLDRLNMSGAHQDIAYWMRAVCGHHGMPPIEKGSAEFHFRPADEGAVGEFILAIAALLLTDEARRIPELAGDAFEEVSLQLSWWFAGLAVLADWLGSNTSFFKYQTVPQRIEDYWTDACTKAVAALQQSGVQPVPVAPGKTLQDFFPYIVEASPLQAWAQQVALPLEPQIYLLEDVTGAGKTEAALLLAYRLMAQGLAQGFFIGLPTMATANAMYGRVAGVYQELFDGRASLTLGHGFKDLVDAFAASVLPADVSERDVAQLDDTASARCTAWLADHNKRVLLAPGGVGTVDQALLAVLHSKHQSLRLLGLFNKVLIVDEVHACDAYMEGVLAELLRFHASMGGSVILLSATLPNRMKSRLLGAYAQGCQSHLTSVSLNSAYPLATRWCAGQSALYQADFPSRKNVSRSVSVRYLSDIEVLYQDIRAALAAGQCVGWIRNTVADAVAAYERLASDIDPEKITLFHARFALADRLRTEEAMLRYFGSASGANERRGRLVIATQVAEQSLDVDFDCLVSDLAPIDRMLQRAGRAHRHLRTAAGDRLPATGGTDGRPSPALWVLAPPWTSTPARDWYAATFKTGQYVYDRHDQLWLTAKALQRGYFDMPEHARELIEMVYSGQHVVPAALQDGALKSEGKSHAEASHAQLNSLSVETGYKRGEVGDWWGDTQTPSRLGEETREVMLARWENGQLSRWDQRSWPYSMVKMAARKIASPELTAAGPSLREYERLRATLPSEGRYCVLLPLILLPDGRWQGQAWTAPDKKSGKPELLTWLYDAELGLRLKESGSE